MKDSDNKENQLKNLTNDYRNACQANISLLDEKEVADEQLDKVTKKVNKLEIEISEICFNLEKKLNS